MMVARTSWLCRSGEEAKKKNEKNERDGCMQRYSGVHAVE